MNSNNGDLTHINRELNILNNSIKRDILLLLVKRKDFTFSKAILLRELYLRGHSCSESTLSRYLKELSAEGFLNLDVRSNECFVLPTSMAKQIVSLFQLISKDVQARGVLVE